MLKRLKLNVKGFVISPQKLKKLKLSRQKKKEAESHQKRKLNNSVCIIEFIGEKGWNARWSGRKEKTL